MKKIVTVVLATSLIAFTGVTAAAPQNVTLAVQHMTCPVCPITVKKALNAVDGVSKTEVNYERKEAVIHFDDAKTNVEALIKATTEAGYPSSVKVK